MVKSLHDSLRDVYGLTEMFIQQDMPERAPEGAPWENTVKNRIAHELQSTKDNQRLVAAFLAESTTTVRLNHVRPNDGDAEFLDKIQSVAGERMFNRFTHELADAIFDAVMESMAAKGERALRDIIEAYAKR